MTIITVDCDNDMIYIGDDSGAETTRNIAETNVKYPNKYILFFDKLLNRLSDDNNWLYIRLDVQIDGEVTTRSEW